MTIKVTRKKKGKKVYICTKEDKLTSVKVYEPKDFFQTKEEF